MELFTDAQKKEMKLLINFVRLYCGAKHVTRYDIKDEVREISGRKTLICRECVELVEYSMGKRRSCPLEPKPACKRCRIHCYDKDHRARIREIMSYSGRRMILQGRVDYIRHFLF